MIRASRKALILILLGATVVAAYVYSYWSLKQTQHQLGITDEMMKKYQQEQAALCPLGFAPMASTDRCFNLVGIVVPKLKPSPKQTELPASAR